MKQVIFFLCILLLIVSFTAQAQPPSAMQQRGTPLENLLNPDGTLRTNTGFNGSLDPRGWKMETNDNGQPRFIRKEQSIASVPADSSWDSVFSSPGVIGVSNGVYAIALSGNIIYASGIFTNAGGVSAINIAKWDGSSWSALGSGMNGWVGALAVIGSDLYAGGAFTTAGGVSANYIAKWDGSSWSALGSGMNDEVQALIVNGSDVYAGGWFTTAGGVSANRIAKWDGSNWSALGSGMDAKVYALAVIGSDVYAGGVFTTAGGISANYIAKWDGSNWSALGSGMNGSIRGIAVSGSNVYAGGYFTWAGGVSANYIAKWDGSNWSALGSGMNGPVYALTVSGGDLYAGGSFGTAGGVSATSIAKWDGSSWSALGSGMSGPVEALAMSGSNLYTCGIFTYVGPLLANNIAKWDGSSWSALGQPRGMDGSVNAFAVSGNDLYAGGSFSTAGGVVANYIAKWDGSNWSALGSGMNGSVNALAVSGGDLYVGGSFDTAGGVSATSIAKWDGSSWSALGSGMTGSVLALAVSGSNVYAGAVSNDYIAKWDGSSWSALGSGTNGAVRALAVSGTDLYVGGDFTTAGGVSTTGIAKWDGSNWSALGSGVSGAPALVRSLVTVGTNLYAGGVFTNAGGISANYIAKWDGSSWTALGSGMNSYVYALAVSSSDLYVGGLFSSAGAKASTFIARWFTTAPVFSTAQSSLSFDTVFVGSNNLDSVQVTNTGRGYLTILSVTSDDSNFTPAPTTVTIGPGQTKTCRITFTPHFFGPDSGNIIFTHNSQGSPDSIKVFGIGIFDSVRFAVNSRWNLISNPMITSNDSVRQLFPSAILPLAYTYKSDSGYVQRARMKNGVGYWEKFTASQNTIIIGAPLNNDSIDVSIGWNLIGSLSVPLPTSSITTIGTSIQSPFYGFNNGYHSYDTVKVGRGYWVKVGATGKLVFSSGAIVPAVAKTPSSTEALSGLNSLDIEDGNGNRQTLYFGIARVKGFMSNQYELPPVPPAGVFDARFASQRMVETVDEKKQKDVPILISSTTYPVRIRWRAEQALTASTLIIDGKEIRIKGIGETQVVNSKAQVVISLMPASLAELPQEFALDQNYPNPFNPSTVIHYQLPVESKVTLKIYNVIGQEVATLVDGVQDAGYKTAEWDAGKLSSGIYIYQMSYVDQQHHAAFARKKMVLLK